MLTDNRWSPTVDTGADVELRVPGEESGVLVTLRPPRRDMQGWEALHFPDETRAALGIPEDEKLYIMRRYEPREVAVRREKAFAELRAKAEADPTATFGMVPLYAMGMVEDEEARYRTAGRADAIAVYEVMQDAGAHRLSDVVRVGKSQVWGPDGQYAALRAMVPVANALTTIHSLELEEWQYGSAAAHRDIKPSNLFVTFEGDDEYRRAAVRGIEEWEGPLVRIVDYGLFYFSNLDHYATSTTNGNPTSAFWTPWDITLGEVGENNPKARDVWSFAATLFFAITGRHPWAAVDQYMHSDLSNVKSEEVKLTAAEMMRDSPKPDSPAFDELDPQLAVLLRDCLGRHRTERPRIGLVTKVIWDLSQEYFTGKAARAADASDQGEAPGPDDADEDAAEPSSRASGAPGKFARLGAAADRHPLFLVGALLAVMLLLVAALFPLNPMGQMTLWADGFKTSDLLVWSKVSAADRCHEGDSACSQVEAVTPLLAGCATGIQGIVMFLDQDGKPADSAFASSGPVKSMQHVTLYFGGTKVGAGGPALRYLRCA